MPTRLGILSGLREALRLFQAEADRFVLSRLVVAVSLVVVAGVLAGVAPMALKLVVDSFAADEEISGDFTSLLLVCAYVFSLYLSRSVGELRTLVFGRADQRLQRRLSARLFSHIMQLPLRFHLDRKSGAVAQTLTTGLTGHQLILQQLLFTIIPATAELLTISAVLAHFDHPAFIVILAVAAICYLIVFSVGAVRLARPARSVSAASIEAHAVLTDTLLNYETVKYFNAESVVADRFDAALVETESHWLRFYRSQTLNGILVATVFGASLSATLLFSVQQVMHGSMTVGDFVLINAYVLQVVRPLELLGFAVRGLSQGFAYLQRMLDLFGELEEPPPLVGRSFSQKNRGTLTFEHVSFSYNPERAILKDVNFSVPAGATLAIVGASGAGKSSLVRLLFRLYEPSSGRILLDSEPISGLSLSSLRRSIAVVPQDTVLLNDTIGNNIAFGRRGSTRVEVEHAARLAHLHDLIVSLPDGYETLVGERGLKLSGGEKQRVAIARAALKQPLIYIFDESTSSLDTHTEREILSNLAEIARQRTTLIIAHRLSTVVHADEIVVLDRGSIAERGNHNQLLQMNGHYAALWRSQQNAISALPTRPELVA